MCEIIKIFLIVTKPLEVYLFMDRNNEHSELMRFIEWAINNGEKWEEMVGFSETEPEQLLEILESLHENGLHAMYFTVLKKNGHTLPLNKILKNLLLEQIEKSMDCGKVKSVENRIIRELELAYRR